MKNVFCLSMQRTATTSVGNFLRDNHYRVCGWRESHALGLSMLWYHGEIDAVFEEVDKNGFEAFEDSPWWYPEFEKEIYKRYPTAKFILIERDPDKWFASMLSHSGKKNPGSARIHARIYRREKDIEEYCRINGDLGEEDTTILDLTGRSEHYKNVYINRNRECLSFLERNHADLYHGQLEAIDWDLIARFLEIENPVIRASSIHANRSRGRRYRQWLRRAKHLLLW